MIHMIIMSDDIIIVVSLGLRQLWFQQKPRGVALPPGDVVLLTGAAWASLTLTLGGGRGWRYDV